MVTSMVWCLGMYIKCIQPRCPLLSPTILEGSISAARAWYTPSLCYQSGIKLYSNSALITVIFLLLSLSRSWVTVILLSTVNVLPLVSLGSRVIIIVFPPEEGPPNCGWNVGFFIANLDTVQIWRRYFSYN